ncbi:sentrin-specific protease 8-like [Lingula anatina]|uniref:Sentrin-specific protease 8-like n=1 Tax=Lingula anatina TaxID=7574 RepID=A0A1S3HKL6_LINAN|nr:sentrin-specific protease 8-like [Lingula anatina]|eukprot:XP_013386562.1 sentrin-specific protease 8-like [Lingula anatina]
MKRMASQGDMVLSFHDSLLRTSDVDTLVPGNWLNDNIIAFAFEYFEKVQFKLHEKDVSFISPDVTQFIKLNCGDELGIFLEPLCLTSKKYIFLVVNDESSAARAGGSHWSLLMFSRPENTFYHHDSCNKSNTKSAKVVAMSIEIFLRATRKVQFKNEESPQQENTCDCGMYAICNTELLCKKHLDEDEVDLINTITPEYVTKKRQEMVNLIHKLASTSK